MNLPNKCEIIIIGGGVSGCSVAYHLSELGWNNIVLMAIYILNSQQFAHLTVI